MDSDPFVSMTRINKTKEMYIVYIHQTSPAGHGYSAGEV